MYLDDSDGCVVYAGSQYSSDISKTIFWYTSLKPYLNLRYCPGWTDPYRAVSDAFMCPSEKTANACGGFSAANVRDIVICHYTMNRRASGKKYSKLSRPSSSILFTEGFYWPFTFVYWNAASRYNEALFYNFEDYKTRRRHNFGMNVLYADGHGAYTKMPQRTEVEY
jgi:prepilin-type processing-associated H-X9-DG protein